LKLDILLKRYPWEETRRQLCAIALQPSERSVRSAGVLIELQRETQVRHLMELMRTPQLEPRYANEKVPPVTPSPKAETDAFQFSSPSRTARLVLNNATRVGKDLRLFSLADLDGLLPATRALGRLLRLLAEAASMRPQERGTLRRDWADLRATHNDFGPVLTPMLRASFRLGSRSAEGEAESLVAAVIDAFDRAGPLPLGPSDDHLVRWIRNVCRAGGQRLAHFRESDLS
jgi:hypothetical protein